jgi:hypothetical protein
LTRVVKRASAPEISRGFRLARAALHAEAVYLVHGGSDTWAMGDGITATSLRDLKVRLLDG